MKSWFYGYSNTKTRFKGIKTIDSITARLVNNLGIQIQRPDLRGLRLHFFYLYIDFFEWIQIQRPDLRGLRPFHFGLLHCLDFFIQIQRPDLRGLRLLSWKTLLSARYIQIQRPDLRGLRPK